MNNKNIIQGVVGDLLYDLGKRMSKVPIVSGVLYKLKKVYLILMPGEEMLCVIKSVQMFLLLVLMWVSMLLFQWSIGADSIYNIAIIIAVLAFVSLGIINKVYCSMQYKLLEQFDNYLSGVRHHFHVSGSIEDTLFDSLEICEGMLKLHIQLIYDLVVSKGQDILERYKDMAPNKYFLTFLGLCQTVMRYGDSYKEGKSVYLENIGYLRDEIRIDIMKQRSMNHTFMGLSVMTILPVFTLPFIENWGKSNLPELSRYYDGVFGLVASAFITALSICSFCLIMFLKNNYRYTEKKHSVLDKALENSWLNKIVTGIIDKKPKKCRDIERLLGKTGESMDIYQFIAKGILVYLVAFIISLSGIVYAVNLQYVQTGSGSFEWWYIIVALALASMCKSIPLAVLRIKKLLMTMNYEDEVMQFHSIIIMLIYIKRMSSDIILEWMCDFADIFKKSLSKCSALYSLDSNKALSELKREESYLPFVRIIENLEDCDRVGTQKAFEEICSQREYFIEKRKQDNEINISNKGAIGKVVGYIPLLVTVFVYLIFPFVAESLNQLLSYVNEINSL